MTRIFEAVTDYGFIRITETMHNYDGIIDKAIILENAYELHNGLYHINKSVINSAYAECIKSKYDFNLIRG